MNFATNILSFIRGLRFPFTLPSDVEVMIPFSDEDTYRACQQFYTKFYSDQLERRMIIGINPGRFGGGVTGIPFTDPIRLQNDCSISNDWTKKQELSSLFIYEMIEAFGGVTDFYRHYYITAVSPLGFTQHGKNLNYYDDKSLQDTIKPFVIDRKNFLFSNTPGGAKGSAVIFTLIQTAIENKLDPFRYLTWLMDTAANMNLNQPENIQQLLPWNAPETCKVK